MLKSKRDLYVGNLSGNPKAIREAKCSVGFTLIELLIVIAIVAMLAAMLLPTLTRAKYLAKNVVCMNQLKQVAGSYLNYASDFENKYPDWGPERIVADYNKGPRPMRDAVAYRNHSYEFAGVVFDLRPTLREYMGPLNDLMTCPLANSKWFRNGGALDPYDIDNYNFGAGRAFSVTSYMLYPTRHKKTAGFQTTKEMAKVGQGFTVNGGNGFNNKTFSILASDRMRRTGWREPAPGNLISTQMPLQGERTISPVASSSDWGWNGHLGTFTYANYAQDDGSVTTYPNVGILDREKQRFSSTWGNEWNYLPADMAQGE